LSAWSLRVLVVEDRAEDAELTVRALRRADDAVVRHEMLEPGLAYLEKPQRKPEKNR
jgi:hypothetical protein